MARALSGMQGVERMKIIGIRHLSPAGAWYVKKTLDQRNPDVVLIEGPSDFSALIPEMAKREVKPPFAVLAYTEELPIETILYPFSIYSPEYQAMLWAVSRGKECRFIDLPSEIFLALSCACADIEEKMRQQECGEEARSVIYEKMDELCGEEDHETFWERTMEHCSSEEEYIEGSRQFGICLRQLEDEMEQDAHGCSRMENILRESYMKAQIEKVVCEGWSEEKIVVVTGAYHVEGLEHLVSAMTEEEFQKLPKKVSKKTLMPYSYYRLSNRSGYGAGNKAPAYYEMIWDALREGKPENVAYQYLASIASYSRQAGGMVSTAEVIDAVRLSQVMAQMKGDALPTLRDLRDAAVTCMGHGSFGEIAVAVAQAEIGTKIGEIPQGVVQTSVQSDFLRLLEELRLEKYKTLTAQELRLDLREKLNVKSELAARIDLRRSYFLHRLRILDISFAKWQDSRQERATWAESWLMQWTPEAEIQIVEVIVKGDTIEKAASFVLKERMEAAPGIAAMTQVLEDAFLCGLENSVHYAVAALQQTAVEEASLPEIGEALRHLSMIVQYGDIRNLDHTRMTPLMQQLFLRACLIMVQSCSCDDEAAKKMMDAIDAVHETQIRHDFLEEDPLIASLLQVARRDDLNAKLSGFCAALLLERSQMEEEELSREVQRRISRGVPAELGAGWLEGLSKKNHYGLIARLSLWRSLSEYVDTLDEEEFKRALVFLRRAFSDFSAKEKDQIAENLGEIWQLNREQTSEVLNAELKKEEQELLESLDEFDFGYFDDL